MDRSACRAQLARLLQDEAALLTRLEAQLQSEHALLKSNDVEGLEQASSARQQTVAGLLRVDDERRQLCRLLGKGEDKLAMAEILRWCDPDGSLTGDCAQCAQAAVRCREQNDRNGALVTARLNRIGEMLRVVNPAASAAGTYAPGSMTTLPRVGKGRFLAVRA